MDKFLVLYLLVINGFAFVAYALDKWKARHYRRRIPEVTLLLLAVVGGSVGALMAIWLFRHKTRHPQFSYGVPAILAIQLGLVWLCACGSARQETPRVDVAAISRGDFNPVDTALVGHSPTTLIVMCDSTIGKEPLRAAVSKMGATVIYDYRIICGMAVAKPDHMTLEATRQELLRVEGVVAVEYDHVNRLIEPVRPPVVDR